MKKKLYGIRYLLFFICLIFFISLELWSLDHEIPLFKKESEDSFAQYLDLVDDIFEDLQCFPVIKEDPDGIYPVSYENTWGEERTYGGNRVHEGCDLMALHNERGRYKVCSMTDGIVENIGWLEMGGWRIGIRSDHGIYYYYAHLDSYEKAFEKGERINAGQILGRMGDSGYGKEPDTKGNFDVHLHVGIYLSDLSGKERAVNPYWFLKHLEI